MLFCFVLPFTLFLRQFFLPNIVFCELIYLECLQWLNSQKIFLIIYRSPISYPHYLLQMLDLKLFTWNSHLLKMTFPRGAKHILFLCFSCLMTRRKGRYFPRNQLPTPENQYPHFRYITLAPLILYLPYILLWYVTHWAPGQRSWKDSVFTYCLWLFIPFPL